MENKYIQQQEFRILGLSRSGNHAIINWLINQIEGKYLFLNCTEPKFNPFDTSRPLDNEGRSFLTNLEGYDLQEEQKGRFFRKDYLIYNHEDCFLGPVNRASQKKKMEKWLGSSRVQRDILILRDPFNLFASRMKAGLINGHYTHHGVRPITTATLLRIYKQHAREFLGEKHYLQNKVLINFNMWCSDKSYRRQLCRELRVPFHDTGFEQVPSVAGGSSFDGTDFSGSSHRMALFDRWRQFATEQQYWSLFDDEVARLAERIFGPTVAIDIFKKLREAGETIQKS